MENHSPTQTPSTIAIPLGPDARQTVLQNDFILRQIFIHLGIPPLPLSRTPSATYLASRSRARKFLGRLALVCRAFSEPARDAMWYSVDSMKPIYRRMTSPVRRTGRSKSQSAENQAPKSIDLVRRIKEINHHAGESQTEFTLFMHSAISRSNHGQDNSNVLFPSLTVLRCTLRTKHGLEILRFRSASLKHLSLYDITVNTIPVVRYLITDLIYMAAPLNVLELRGDVQNIDIALYEILHFRSLTSLSITSTMGNEGITVDAINRLAALEYLEHFEIDLGNWNEAEENRFYPHNWKSSSTRTLKSVTVRGTVIGILGFMSAIEGASLTDLDVTITAKGILTVERAPYRLFSVLGHAGRDSIRNLSIVDQERLLPGSRVVPTGSTTRRRGAFSLDSEYGLVNFFLGFTLLESLTYDTSQFYFWRMELEQIIKNPWKGSTLTSFSMPNGSGNSNDLVYMHNHLPPQVCDLRALVVAFPKLEYIQLHLDITSSNIPNPNTLPPQSLSQVKVLSLGSLTTAEEFNNLVDEGTILLLGEYFFKLFPKLQEIRYNEESPIQCKLWKFVYRIVELKRR